MERLVVQLIGNFMLYNFVEDHFLLSLMVVEIERLKDIDLSNFSIERTSTLNFTLRQNFLLLIKNAN